MSRSSHLLQDISGEHLNRGSKKAQGARLYMHAHGFWEQHRSGFFDVRVCHPNAASYRDLEPQQIYHIHENEKKRLYPRRVLEIEHGTFTPLVFNTTGRMEKECLMYHSHLASWLLSKKGSSMPKPSHGSEPEPHSRSWDLHWFVLEALRYEECHVTLRMLILMSKLLKEPFNWTIDVFSYF